MKRRPGAPSLRLVSEPPAATANSLPAHIADGALDDESLLERLRQGERAASDALFHRVLPRVEGTIRKILGGRDQEHEDLVQLAMLELVTSVHRFRGDSSLESWAASITAHVVFNYLRRRTLERKIFSAAELPPQVPAQGSVGRSIVARDLLRELRRLLDAMDPDRAWAFVLHDICGFDLREIARITGASVSAAQARLVRGRHELHERIAGHAELADACKNMGVEP